ncbi:sirohydrochlorin cobaltochelatase [Halosquirtibacter laminarini]|uniref:Sirohydrochlorin cobaltochelatase n=1 Tax=Halosquirtibacter laminarini TaxID=3374600 RepID=A0AC61NM19_9BACT|nr:sirohydrochlorin cobaltochelatase [Prolixibacteraceae bacterium]
MKRCFVLMMILWIVSSCGVKDRVGEKEHEAILLVTFGSSYEAPAKTFQNIEDEFKKAYPNKEVTWAFTSKFIRKKLHKRGIGKFKAVYSPEDALIALKKDGFSHIAVQSLHVIPGSEYHDLKKKVSDFKKENPKMILTLGTPLMDTQQDLIKLADLLIQKFDDKNRTVVLMGHGSEHPANNRYTQFTEVLRAKKANFIVGTVEATPSIVQVKEELKNTSHKNILLMPLMSVAGDHATNDMAGDEPDSWKTILTGDGYQVNCLLQGLCDYDEVVDIYIQHLKKSMR